MHIALVIPIGVTLGLIRIMEILYNKVARQSLLQ